MTTLMPTVVLGLLLIFISDRQSEYIGDPYGSKSYVYKDRLFFGLAVLVLGVFVGLRTRGNDTYTYKMMYESIPAAGKLFTGIEWTNLSSAPGLTLLCRILRRLGASAQDYFMVTGLFVTTVYLWFIRKHTTNLSLSAYYFITMGVYTFSMAAIKQTMAVAFLMFATDVAIEKKWIKFAFWIAIAELFHPYAFVYLVIPFLFFSPWTKGTYILIVGTIIISLFMSQFLGALDVLTSSLGYSYDTDAFTSDGVNIFRVIVVWVPVLLSFLGRRALKESTDRSTNLIINMTMVNAVIMFVGLFGTANYFARLANYFLIFQTLSLPWLLRFFEDNSRNLVKYCSILCFFFYFYYSNVLAQGRFDDTYSFMSIFQYLSQLF